LSAKIRTSRARKAQIFGGVLVGVIVILFAGHLVPGFIDVAPTPARVVDLTCPPDCPDGIGDPVEINPNINGTFTVTFDPNPPVTSLDSLLTQLADNVDSPIVPTSDKLILTSIITLEDSVGNQKVSAQQTALPQQNIVASGEDLQVLNNGRILINFFVETDLPQMTYIVSGGLFNEDRSIDIILVDAGVSDENGNFQIEINNSPALLEGITGEQLVYSYSMVDMKITIGGLQFGFNGVQQLYRLDVAVDTNGFITYVSDSTEPLRFLPSDGVLTITSKTNEQFQTRECLVTSTNDFLDEDCLDDQILGNIITYQAPSLASVLVNGESGATVGLNSGDTLTFELNRNSNYTVALGAPFDFDIKFETPASQKSYNIDCWILQFYDSTFSMITNGTLRTDTLDGNNLLECDIIE